MLIAAAAAGLVAMADGVESGVVGYNTVSVSSDKWYMIAPQFEGAGTETSATADLLAIMTVNGVTAETWANRASASQIQVFNPATSTYVIYYYTTNAGTTGWRRTPNIATEIPVSFGAGVWLKIVTASEGANITLSGQVKETNTYTVNIGEDGTWQIVSNPFPTPITQANITTTGLTAETWANRANASQIQVFNPATATYTIYYYTSGNGGTFWRRSPAAPAATEEICPIGQSVWVKALSVGSLTFSM